MTLSKSDYMLFLRHPAWLWLKKHEKHKLPPVDASLQALFDAGNLFESYAEQIFPHAVKLGFDNHDEYRDLPQRTKEVLDDGVEAIMQGRFEANNLTCVVDVLEKNNAGSYDLTEIKASTKAKPEHHYDLAFQVVVLQDVGFQVDAVKVVHANPEYVRNGEIDPEGITASTDVSSEVFDLLDITRNQILEAQKVIVSKTRPSISSGLVNQLGVPSVSKWMEEWLDIFKTLQPSQDLYSIYNLSYPSPQQIAELEEAGISSIMQMSEEQALRDKQRVQIQTTVSDTPIVEPEKIREFIDQLQYPLYFFDYETFSSVVPQFDGCSPYKDYPFQYSVHVLESPDAEPKHYEYIHKDTTNPMPALLEQLRHDIGTTGTVLTWNMGYEKGCNDRMAELYPEHADFLNQLNERINDLMIPFAKMWYFHKDFFGSASVKKVMPVLAPELSYKELNVGDGLLARRMWTETVLEGQHQNNRVEIMEDLSKYCTLDTYAMMRIYEELLKLVKERQ